MQERSVRAAMAIAAMRLDLTRTRSATAGETERELESTCVHKVKGGRTSASGWLHRLVRQYSVGKSAMRKVEQYLEDGKIGNGMSDKRNQQASRLCP